MTGPGAASSPTVMVLADDLSGAAESASVFLGRQVPLTLHLDTAADQAGVTVTDLNTRALNAPDAQRILRSALAGLPTDAILVKKIDSLLRGAVGAEVGVLADRGPVIVAAALPVLDRVVERGVLHVNGVPLHRTRAWAAEPTLPPHTIAELFGDRPTAMIPTGGDLADAVSKAVANGEIAICDATTDADLDAVVRVSRSIRDAQLVGTAALAAAVARTLPAGTPESADRPPSRHVLTVVGTAEPIAAEQSSRLVALGFHHLVLDADALLSETADPAVLSHALDQGHVLITLRGNVAPARARALSAALGRFVAAGQGRHRPDLVLTGGETARAVVDAVGLTTLHPIGEVHHGAVVCLASDGRSIVTRPGSFGDATSLTAIAGYLLAGNPPVHPTTEGQFMSSSTTSTALTDAGALPVVAVTMGDGAGVGPEVIVPALLDDAVRGFCVPIVIGDAKRLVQAADILGVDADIVAVRSIADAEQAPGRINVIDLDLLPADLPWGELSPVAGHAAYEYIRVASELAVRGEVQAICTAPLNKEALHAAGHIYPGHTELLADLTGTEEVSMMLSTPKLKVIHVTTHIGLLDAVSRIEPGLVERTIRRGHEALVRAGIAAPKIGVCGINPHAGENGLFGYGEEEKKIIPAIEILTADGIDVHGPLPADTAFFLAGRGDYDLIVAMYHDQGHGPVKVLGIEAGVNITVGLPVIRTSVDHGTAFDIAGKGIAEAGSMVEALRQAAELASSATVAK
ncbi:4-hydroxythreonine-4-phosphate dehydrogenase PdxA [Mycobacterium sp. URHB0044]|uniref:4-hydroxythreonine-4-phosphate dehydrogenase PdxA n=1 Tax=Mycobacterium sp. URHB0044 TaxID=1380386 RepID=UPI00048BF21E|nr:4-hydroxythreonine-4-phosphate dehydrogenase PdxA [Mycobacterium sp. URHB0044]